MAIFLGFIMVGAVLGLLLKRGEPGVPQSKIKVYSLMAVAAICAIVMMFFIRGGFFVFIIFLMASSFMGMLYCAKYQKVYANAQNAAVTLLVVVFFCMIIILTYTMGDWETAIMIENEMKYSKAAAEILGRTLAKRYPGGKALIIVPENYEKNKRTNTILEGLEDGLDDKVDIVAVDYPKVEKPKPDPNNPDEMPPDFLMFEEMVHAEHFDKLIKTYDECNIIISLIGLPSNAGDMMIWEMEEEKRPVMVLMFGDIYNLKRAIYAGYIIALSYKPGIKFDDEPPPSDPQKAFERRYIILTPDNIEEVVMANPKFFSSDDD